MTTRICLSGDQRCSGLAPCLACYDRFTRFVLPRAMFLAGGPFTADPRSAYVFLGAFAQAWAEARAHAEGTFTTNASASPVPAATVQETSATVSPETFRAALLEQVARLNPDQVSYMREKVGSGKLEGWEEYTEEEKVILREVLGPVSDAGARTPANEAPPAPFSPKEEVTRKEGKKEEGDAGAEPAKMKSTTENGTAEAAPKPE